MQTNLEFKHTGQGRNTNTTFAEAKPMLISVGVIVVALIITFLCKY